MTPYDFAFNAGAQLLADPKERDADPFRCPSESRAELFIGKAAPIPLFDEVAHVSGKLAQAFLQKKSFVRRRFALCATIQPCHLRLLEL